MPAKNNFKLKLSPFGPGSLFSYELSGEHIIGRLFGIAPLLNIHLGAVHYLRLATPTETPPFFLLFNWVQFLSYRRAVRPVYVLQTRSRHRIFLKLDSGTHFRLRQAIGRHAAQGKKTLAA